MRSHAVSQQSMHVCLGVTSLSVHEFVTPELFMSQGD